MSVIPVYTKSEHSGREYVFVRSFACLVPFFSSTYILIYLSTKEGIRL